MFKAKVLPNGNLMITADNVDEGNTIDILQEELEHYWTNGSFTPFDPSNGNPYIGLTEAPCIAESMDIDDDGNFSIIGRYWAFMEYMTVDPIEELRNKGKVIFTLIQEEN